MKRYILIIFSILVLSITSMGKEVLPPSNLNNQITNINNTYINNNDIDYIYIKYGNTRYWKELDALTPEQKKILYSSYGVSLGKKVNNGFLLSAIAWKESDFGRDKINKQYVGVYQANPNLIINNPNYNLEKYKSIRHIRNRLLNDHNYSKRIAIAELKYWYKYWTKKKIKNNIELNVLASYNVGILGIKSKAALKYAKDVVYRAKILEYYLLYNKYFNKKQKINIINKKINIINIINIV